MLRQYAEKFTISNRLSLMMFLQFFIWGSWYVVGPLYLRSIGFTPGDFGWMYRVGPIACLISPVIVGMVADRFFPTEKVLGVMHILAAAVMFYATTLMLAKEPSANLINIAFFVHMLFYFPTLALTNSLSLHTMTDPEAQFPKIRVFGTIGWVIAGQLISYLVWDATINVFYLAAFSGLFLGIYSFTLPHTPPPLAGKKVALGELVGTDAFVLFKHKAFLIFMVSSVLICIPLAFYYQLAARAIDQAGIGNAAATMTYGQISEIVFMMLMPLFFKRLGVKYMLLVGMLAWVVRYGLFAVGSPVTDAGISNLQWMLILGIVLHGICYDFFFVTGQIYTDKVAPKEIRGQAQGMLALFTLGLGMMIGAFSAEEVEKWCTTKESAALHDEAETLKNKGTELEEELKTEVAKLSDEQKGKLDQEYEVVSAFHKIYETAETDVPNVERINEDYDELTSKSLSANLLPALEVKSQLALTNEKQGEKKKLEEQNKRWLWIWMIPALFAAAIMAGFFVTFKESEAIDAGDVPPDGIEPPLETMAAAGLSEEPESEPEKTE